MKNAGRPGAIGLVGGMGPHATAYFYKLLLTHCNEHYGARGNDSYPEFLINSLPSPDCISDLSELDLLREMIVSRFEKLQNFGCNILSLVCNTGHLICADIAVEPNVEFVSMVDSVTNEAQIRKHQRVGLLSTVTTIEKRVYDDPLEKSSIAVIKPDTAFQETLTEIIRDLVAGVENEEQKSYLFEESRRFAVDNSLDALILGCTELPLIFPQEQFNELCILDCLAIHSRAILARYYGE